MAYISGSGTMSAAPITALASSSPGPVQRFARRLGVAMMLVGLLPGAAPISTLDVTIDNVRSARGVLRVCLTADPRNFPGCVDDAQAVTRTVPANSHQVQFGGLPLGNYAVAVIHDENDNARLDTVLGIPREGFGFSRNPRIGFGPPRFAAAEFPVSAAAGATQSVRMRYLL